MAGVGYLINHFDALVHQSHLLVAAYLDLHHTVVARTSQIRYLVHHRRLLVDVGCLLEGSSVDQPV